MFKQRDDEVWFTDHSPRDTDLGTLWIHPDLLDPQFEPYEERPEK